MQREELPLHHHIHRRAQISPSFAYLGHPLDQAELGQGAAGCHRPWWVLEPHHAVPASHFCHYTLLPLFQPAAPSEEGKFAAWFLHVTWKMASFAGVLPSVRLGSPREDLHHCLPETQKNPIFTSYWTTPTLISKDYSLFNLGYCRSSVNTTVGSGLLSIIVQKPSSSMRLLGTLGPLQKSQRC